MLLVAMGAAGAATTTHAGPVLTITVQRGEDRLPIYYVDKLQKGDQIHVATDRNGNTRGAWALVLALASPTSNAVTTRQFDLTAKDVEAGITLTADDQVPILVIAPQIKTLFGLSTSFDQSAGLIVDAITNDPQRFIALQKIEQINLAITSLTSGLDALVLTLKAEQAVESAKTLASKFGVKRVDPECFKGGAVDTRCVATSIVSSRDLTLPSIVELGSLAQPFAAATLPPDILANVRLVAAASSFLSNKYRDQYDFAPSFAKRDSGTDSLQLLANARFQNGDIKTAYVYVPSWFAGKQPELSINAKQTPCLASGELPLLTKGQLPLSNFWHGWALSLHAVGNAAEVAHKETHIEGVSVHPEKGILAFAADGLPMYTGSIPPALEARLRGRYAFTPVTLGPVRVAVPWQGDPQDQMQGLGSLVSGDKAAIRFVDEQAMACAERVVLVAKSATLASAPVTTAGTMELDLKAVDAGEATLDILQTGGTKLALPVRILPRRARVARVERHELENDVTVFGEHLDRIESLTTNDKVCTPGAESYQPLPPGARRFVCPPDVAPDGAFPARLRVVHLGQDPPAFETSVTRLAARPHVALVSGKNLPLIVLSTKAVQWGLALKDSLVSEDSGLALVLRVDNGYKLVRGTYALQLKFGDEPPVEQTPFTVPLMADLTHNELRTRSPINFQTAHLPSITNPVWFRVAHQPSGFAGDWLPVNKAVISLPSFGAAACRADGKGLQIPGSQLDLIDWASRDMARTVPSREPPPSAPDLANLAPCDKGLCLNIDKLGAGKRLKVKVQWINDRLFDVTIPVAPNCMSDS
jgi:hypothetical protein